MCPLGEFIIFTLLLLLSLFNLLSLFRVTVPMGGSHEVYTSLEQRREFSYANVRKATYRGSERVINSPIILIINILSVFKFCVIWGIFLTWFTDALLFTMMIKTSYKDGVNSHQDLIDKDMTLSNTI